MKSSDVGRRLGRIEETAQELVDVARRWEQVWAPTRESSTIPGCMTHAFVISFFSIPAGARCGKIAFAFLRHTRATTKLRRCRRWIGGSRIVVVQREAPRESQLERATSKLHHLPHQHHSATRSLLDRILSGGCCLVCCKCCRVSSSRVCQRSERLIDEDARSYNKRFN